MISWFKRKKHHPAVDIADALKKSNIHKTQQLLKAYPEIHRFTPSDGTWLHYAARYSKVDVLKELVSLGYDVNDCSCHTGARPIVGAANAAQNENVIYLINEGSKLDVSESVVNPLFGAIIAGRGRSEHIVMERAQETAKILLEAGVDFSKTYSNGGEQYDAKTKATEWGATEILHIIEGYESTSTD